MSEVIVFPQPDGANYVIPDVGDQNWGQNVTNFLVAIPNGVMPRAGLFTLTGDVTLGGTFALLSNKFRSLSANTSSTGFIQMANAADFLGWRNFANSADLLLGVNASNQLTFNGSTIPVSGGFVSSITG